MSSSCATGSTARGGAIPVEVMRQYIAIAMNNDLAESSIRKVIDEVRATYPMPEPKVA